MNKKYKLAALIAGGYLFIGVFRIYGSAQLSHYFLGDDEPLVLSAKEILSRAISLFASAGILFGITLLFTRRLYQAIDNHTALFQKDPNPLAVFNLDTLHYIRANPAFLSALGYTEKQVKFITIYDSENVAKTVQRLVLQNSTEFVSLGVWEVLLHDGSFAKIEASICLTRWDNVQRGLVRMHDVTQQQKGEQQLIKLNEDLEKQVELRTRELAEMNHELQAYNEELHATNEAAIKANELIQQSNAELSLLHSRLKVKSAQLVEQSEEKINKILDTISEVIWAGRIFKDNSIKVDFVNSAIESFLGVSVEDMLRNIIPAEQLAPEVKAFLNSDDRRKIGTYYLETEQEVVNYQTGVKKWVLNRVWFVVGTNPEELHIDATMSDITDRKNAEGAIKAQQEMLQGLIDNLPLMIMLLDKDNNVQYVNNQFINPHLPEVDPKKFIGASLDNYINQTLNSPSDREWVKHLLESENQWINYEGVSPIGEKYYMKWIGVPSANGGRIHIGRDTTQTQVLEQDLKQQRELLQTIVDNLPQYVVAVDNEGIYRFFGKSYVKLFERITETNPYDVMYGKKETDFITNRYQNVNNERYETALKFLESRGEAFELPFSSKKSGEVVYISWYRIALPDGGFLNVGQDITPRRKLMADLEEQREMLQTLIESLPLKIVFVDKHKNIKFINENFELLNAKWYVGRSLQSFVKDAFSDESIQRKALSTLSESYDWTDLPITKPNGEEVHNTWLTIPFPDSSFIAIGQDITLRKRSEAEKNRLLEQLITQNNDLLQFSYIASHNLRGPVASILGLINLLEYNPNVDSHKEILTHIQSAMNNLDNVIRDINLILEFRNIESHQNQQVYLEQVIVLVVESFRSQLDACNIRISIDVQVSWVYTIHSYVYSIIHNLISNAIKYRDLSKASIIRVEAIQQHNEVLITIHDNGKGIDLHRFKDKLFLLYQRFDFDVTGRGLGLFMAKTQAEALGGRLVVKSEPGRGSSFTLSLPIIESVSALQGA